MRRDQLRTALILGVAVVASSLVSTPIKTIRRVHSQQTFTAPTCRPTSSQLFIFGSILDALTGRSDNTSNNRKNYNNNRKRIFDYDDNNEPVKRYRGEPGLGGTSSPYYGPLPYGYAKGNTRELAPPPPPRDFVRGGDAYYPRQEEMNQGYASYSRTGGEKMPLPTQAISTTDMEGTISTPATARGTWNNSSRMPISSAVTSSPTTMGQRPPEKMVPGGNPFSAQSTGQKTNQTQPTSSTTTTRANRDFSDYFTTISSDPSSFAAIGGGSKEQMAIQLKQALNKIKTLQEDNYVLVRELRIARGVEEDLVKAQERLEQEVARLQKQLIQYQNRYQVTDYERQDLTQKINLYVQERDATRVNYQEKLDISNRLAQAERRLRLTGIYVNDPSE